MKYLFTVLFFSFACVGVSAQEIFQKHLGSAGADYMTDMRRLPDGSFVALGYSQMRHVDSSYAQLFKLDSNMNIIWSRTFTFNNKLTTNDLTMTNDKGFLIGGRTWQTPTAVATQGGFVIKTDSMGISQWSRIFKFDGSETVIGAFQEADSTYRYFVAGATTTAYIKADRMGVPNAQIVNPTNGTYDMIARKVVRLGNERFALLGAFQNAADHILVLNRDTIQWTREYSGILNEGRIFNITTDAAGNIFFVGDYRAGNYPLRQVHVGKLIQNGNVRWTTALPLIKNGGRGIDTVWRFTIANHLQIVGNRLYASGSMLNEQKEYSYGIISAFDTTLNNAAGRNWLWTRQYGSRTGVADSFARIFVLPNRQLLGVGHTGLGNNSNTPNFYFVKTDTSGTSSCNYASYSPVEEITSTAYLAIPRPFVGLANAMTNLTTYNDAIPTSNKAPLSNTTNICNAQICPAGTVTAAVTPLTVCRLDTVTITSSGATGYLWSSSAMTEPRTDSTFRVPIATEGAYTFSLSAQPRGANCFASVNITVIANPLPITGVSAPREMCAGDSLTIASGTQAPTVVWSSSTNSPWRAGSTITSIVAKPVSQGVHVYNIRTTDARGCVNYNNTTITVRPNVTPTVTFDPIGCPGPDLVLRARGTNEGTAPFFSWLVEGNLVGGRRELVLPNAIGKRVRVIMNVGADICPVLPAPAGRQVSSAEVVVSCQGVSTQEIEDLTKISVYPNPNDGNFSVKIDLEAAKTVSFRIVNILGQTVHQLAPRQVSAGELIENFNVQNLATGMYFIETRLDNKAKVTKIQVTQ